MDRLLHPSGGENPDFIGLSYAALLFIGGLIGLLRRGSMMSLIGGAVAAALQFYGSQRVTVDNMDVMFALWTNAALCAFMTYRFTQTERFMPAGLISMLSLVLICRYAIMIA